MEIKIKMCKVKKKDWATVTEGWNLQNSLFAHWILANTLSEKEDVG